MQALVSVVVPVYKVEDCIERCLNSLCRQSLRDIEIIVVDDASPDHCGKICEEFAAKDTRFKVFHQSVNRGLSVARNLGIRNATSKYLMFVDSDDYVHEDFCRDAYECAVRYQADLVMFNQVRVIQQRQYGRKIIEANTEFTEGYLTHQQAVDLMLTDGGNAAWNKLYRKELFEDIFYPEGFLYEDTGATYKLVVKAPCIYYLNKALYYYCFHEGSITSQKATKRVLEDRVSLNLQRYNDLLAWGYNSEALDYSIKYFALWYCTKKKRDLLNPNYIFLSKILQTGNIPKKFSGVRKFALVIFKLSPSLFELVCTLLGTKIC